MAKAAYRRRHNKTVHEAAKPGRMPVQKHAGRHQIGQGQRRQFVFISKNKQPKNTGDKSTVNYYSTLE